MRRLSEIAKEITADWLSMSIYAAPYIRAMLHLSLISDKYICEDGEGIVLRFLCNAGSWRGPVARRIKAELKSMLPKH